MAVAMIVARIRRFAWANGYRNASYILGFSAYSPSIVLALLTPSHILSNHPWVGAFAKWMSESIPSIRPTASISQDPEVWAFYFAVMWAMTPLWLILMFLLNDEKGTFERMQKRKWFALFVLSWFFPLCIYAVAVLDPTSPSGHQYGLLHLMVNSRLGLALAGPIGPFGTSLCTLGLIRWLKLIPRLYFGKGQ